MNTKELLRICEKHPELPIVPLVDGEIFEDDCGWNMGSLKDVEVGEVADYNDRYFDDREDFKDYFCGFNSTDIDEAFGDDNAAIEKYLDKVADEHFRKAIIVYIGALD